MAVRRSAVDDSSRSPAHARARETVPAFPRIPDVLRLHPRRLRRIDHRRPNERSPPTPRIPQTRNRRPSHKRAPPRSLRVLRAPPGPHRRHPARTPDQGLDPRKEGCVDPGRPRSPTHARSQRSSPVISRDAISDAGLCRSCAWSWRFQPLRTAPCVSSSKTAAERRPFQLVRFALEAPGKRLGRLDVNRGRGQTPAAACYTEVTAGPGLPAHNVPVVNTPHGGAR